MVPGGNLHGQKPPPISPGQIWPMTTTNRATSWLGYASIEPFSGEEEIERLPLMRSIAQAPFWTMVNCNAYVLFDYIEIEIKPLFVMLLTTES
jgi:hypothetical protein